MKIQWEIEVCMDFCEIHLCMKSLLHYIRGKLQISSLFSGSLVAQRLSPATNTVNLDCPGFSSRLEQAVLSQHVTSVYSDITLVADLA